MSQAPRDENFVPAALFEIDGQPGSVMPGQIDQATGRILTNMGGAGSGTVTSVSVVSANGLAGTVATATTTPAITLTTTVTGILKGNGTAISAITVGSGLSYDGTTLSATGGGTGDVVGPASATDNAVARFDTTTGKLIQNSAMTVDDTGAFVASDLSKVSGSEGGGFGYIVLGVENTSSGGRAELSLDTDEGAFAGFVAMAGSATTNKARQFDIGTRVAGAIGFWTTDVERVTINAGGTAMYPTVTDTVTLGTSSLMWSDLFLASGGVINWNNGNVTLTHAAGKLTLAGGDLTITAAETPLLVTNTTDTASVEGFSIEGDRATPAANDEVYQTFRLSDSAGNQTSFARIVVVGTNVTDTAETADLKLQTVSAGTLASRAVLNATALRPNANDGIALGSATVSFSDLFLAEGGVINWDNGDATMTQTGNDITFAGITTFGVGTSTAVTLGTIELGAASDTTISRASAGVAAIEGNNIVVNTSSPTLATITTTGNIELGNASDTTLSRSAAGVLAVEGVVIPSISSTNTLTNKRITPRVGTTTSSATPTINTDNVDYYSLTAQTVDITSFTTNLSGTPTDAQKLWISITGTAARAITWGASFEASTVALPTTTVTTDRLDVGFVWNAATSKWRCVATA